jgi:hypothetical protein
MRRHFVRVPFSLHVLCLGTFGWVEAISFRPSVRQPQTQRRVPGIYRLQLHTGRERENSPCSFRLPPYSYHHRKLSVHAPWQAYLGAFVTKNRPLRGPDGSLSCLPSTSVHWAFSHLSPLPLPVFHYIPFPVVPSPFADHRFSTDNYHLLLWCRTTKLRLPILPLQSQPSPCRHCSIPMDIYGDRLFACIYSKKHTPNISQSHPGHPTSDHSHFALLLR